MFLCVNGHNIQRLHLIPFRAAFKPSFTGEQRWHRLLHRDALHHAPPRLHLHHRLQVGDDKAYGRGHDGPLPCLRHHLPRPL